MNLKKEIMIAGKKLIFDVIQQRKDKPELVIHWNISFSKLPELKGWKLFKKLHWRGGGTN
jgi:hypothetical protein